jgi:hypothetical protein
VTVKRAIRLLVALSKSLTSSAPPRDPATAASLDHFECCEATGVGGGPTINVQDQFGTGIVNLLTPVQLCVPTAKNGGGIPNSTAKLLCYTSRLVSGNLHGPKSAPVFVNNQFGPTTLPVVGSPDQFCVPSSPSGAFLDGGDL